MTTRREFLQWAGAGLLTPFVPGVLSPRRALAGADPASVFGLSVASGDPSPTGVVLWTRVNPAAYLAEQPLHFEVSTTSSFGKLVASGEIAAADFDADRDHTVHLDLDGWLQPNRVYYYRFLYGEVASRTGRCRTLPATTAPLASLRLGVVTCQDYTNGYYGAFAHLANEQIDFVLHLGDFIYETNGDPDFQPLPYPDRTFSLPSGQPAAVDLADYRTIYRTYRSDPYFQQLLERQTLIALWDDHETANDCYWDYERDTLGAPSHPYANGDAAQLRQLKLDAQRAWTEYVPARVLLNPAATHPHDYLQIYRKFRFGNLIELFATDERTYRSPHPCGEENRILTQGCSQQGADDQTMLGTTQREWFVNGVTGSSALWKVWANEVFLGQLKIGRRDGTKLFANLDAWDGYEGERADLLQTLADRRVKNLVALTGDLHSYMAAYLKVDYGRRSNRAGANLVGVEFMTPAVTSSTLIQDLFLLLAPDDQAALHAEEAAQPSRFYFENSVKQTNPHVHFFNSQEWGYSIVEFTPQACVYSAYSVDTSTNSATATKRLIRQIRVPVNQVRFEDVV